MGWFNGWFGTRWYGLLYGHRNAEDAAEMAKPIMEFGGLQPGDKLLDMGCGRGRHAELFADAGLDVTGIDLSRASIEHARACVPKARFEIFDIREPYAQGTFDAVVCLFTSLGYSGDRNDDQRAIDAAAAALKSGGLFVLDLLNGEQVAPNLVPFEVQEIEGVRFTIRRSLEQGGIVKKVTVEERGEQHGFEERVHAWQAEEVSAMLHRSGFIVERWTDGTCLAPFLPNGSDRMVVWARKPA
ncbi:MAG: class I SAM-dependent methyltransferase [Flavobacteriales bacterium]|nr:class I SAM-dependent methyltransferase [Flavobacteriales bacterium]